MSYLDAHAISTHFVKKYKRDMPLWAAHILKVGKNLTKCSVFGPLLHARFCPHLFNISPLLGIKFTLE